MRLSRRVVLLAFLLAGGAAPAQSPGDAASRFPQPVRVGDLLHRTVLRPLESQPVIGHVAQVVRQADGTLDLVIEYGGVLGLGARPIALPVGAVALLGADVEVVGLTPKQLDGLPTYTGAGAAPVAPDETIRVGLAGPSH